MVGTLWHNQNGILVCTEYLNGFLHLTYVAQPQYKSCAHESNIHMNYTQLTQPQEGT